jgi:hypothetical protein
MKRSVCRAAAWTAGAWMLGAPLRAETVPEAVARYENLKLGDHAIQVSGVPIRVGHMDATLVEGTLAPVLAGTETVGFYFLGKGNWTYVSESPDEFPVLRRDADKITHWEAKDDGGKLVLADKFDEFLWIEPEGAGWPSKGQELPLPQKGFEKHRDYFARRKFGSLSQRLAFRSLDGSSGKLAYAEFGGGRNEAIYLYDAVEDFNEGLSVVKKREFDSANAPDELSALPISNQPIGRDFRQSAPVPAYLTRVEPTIEADGEDAKVSVEETWQAGRSPVRLLHLYLTSRVFADSALDIRKYDLEKIETADGRPVPFDHRNGVLLLSLPEPLAPGARVKLRFSTSGRVLYPPGGDSYWMLGFNAWYPQPDLRAESFTWKCAVRVKAPFLPIVSGRETSRKSEGNWNSVVAEIDEPIILPVVLAGKYHIDEEKISGRTYRVASYAYTNKRATEHLAKLASQIIDFYEPFLGPFPWKEFTIVEINSLGFGVAPPATMFITREAFHPHEDDFTKLLSQGLNERFAHEIAHQYWGHQVKWGDDENEWLSESFAEYCSALAVRRIKGKSYYKSMIATWRGGAHDASDHATIPTANRLLGEGAFRDRFGLLYGKGPYLLYALNQELGDETFLTSLKTFQSNLRWKDGSTALYENLLEFLTKKSWKDFFEKYYWGTEMPKVKD